MGCLARIGIALVGIYVVFSVWRNRGVLTHAVIVLIVGIGLAWMLWRFLGRGVLGTLAAAFVVLLVLGSALPAAVWAPGTVQAERYAALGDSYASGEGAHVSGQTYLMSSGSCHRSRSAYPKRVASTLTTRDLLFAACSGATTDDLRRVQLPALRRFADTGPVDLVTVTIGGNDLGFRQALHQCVADDCRALDPFAVVPGMSRVAFMQRVADILTEIRSVVGPEVPVLLVGYPVIFPTASVPRCFGIVGIAPGELDALRRATAQVDAALEEAAARTGAQYVDTVEAFAGHEICTADAWAHGLTAPDIAQLPAVPAPDSFHPTPKGHRRLARLVRTMT